MEGTGLASAWAGLASAWAGTAQNLRRGSSFYSVFNFVFLFFFFNVFKELHIIELFVI